MVCTNDCLDGDRYFYNVNPDANSIGSTDWYKQHKSQQQIEALESTTDAQIANTLQQIKDKIIRAKRSQSKYISDTFTLKADLDNALENGKLIVKKDAQDEIDEALKLSQSLPKLYESAMQDFELVGERLKDKELPTEILKRHDEAVTEFENKYTQYDQLIEALRESDSDTTQHQALEKLEAFLSEQQFKRSQQPFDPEHLPGQMLEADPENLPRLNESDYTQAGISIHPFYK